MANSKRKCGFCGKRSNPETMFIKGPQAFCSKDEYIENCAKNVKPLAKKGRVIQKKEATAKKREFKKNDLSHQKELTQNAFNRLRVMQELLWFQSRGIEPYCISCLKPLGGDQWCCGHFKSRGASPELRYDPKNTFLQHNVRCNKNLSGDIEGTKTTVGYKKGLVERFGTEKGNEIIDYCESHHPAKNYTCDQLEEMRRSIRKEIKELEQCLF